MGEAEPGSGVSKCNRRAREHNLEEKDGARKTQWKTTEHGLPSLLCSAQISWQVFTSNLHWGSYPVPHLAPKGTRPLMPKACPPLTLSIRMTDSIILLTHQTENMGTSVIAESLWKCTLKNLVLGGPNQRKPTDGHWASECQREVT